MTAIVYLLAGLIVLVRVYVPISITVLGLWPLRFSLFFLWFLAVKNVGGPSWRNFVRTLRSRSTEMTYYGIWVAVLTCFWLLQQGEHLLTSYLLTAYIGAIPFYFVGTYFSVSENKGRRMALATAVVVGITCLIAIPNVWQDPTLVRMGAIDSTAETRSLGIGSYGDLTGFGIVLPFFISSAFQSRRFARMLGIVACGATVALLMISTFSGMILLAGMAVTGCILYYLFLGGIHLRRTLWTSAAVMVVGVATIALFPGVSERGQFAFDKLGTTSASLPDILAGEADDPTQRYTLMLTSLSVFLEYPIFGNSLVRETTWTPRIGGHSSWIDALAIFGVVGCIPYIMWHLFVARRLWRAWRSDRTNAVYWGCLLSCGLYLFYGFFNVTTQSTTIALFVYVIAAGGQPTLPPRRRPVWISRPANTSRDP